MATPWCFRFSLAENETACPSSVVLCPLVKCLVPDSPHILAFFLSSSLLSTESLLSALWPLTFHCPTLRRCLLLLWYSFFQPGAYCLATTMCLAVYRWRPPSYYDISFIFFPLRFFGEHPNVLPVLTSLHSGLESGIASAELLCMERSFALG